MATSPTPPRFWWLKRLVPAVALVAFAWAGFHWWLTRHVAGELAARVEAWRAAGDGPLPEQIGTGTGIPPKTVDGELNAADLLLRAANAFPTPTQAQYAWEFSPVQMPVPPELVPVLRSILNGDAPAFDLARQATAAPAVDWNRPTEATMNHLTTLSAVRNLANQLGYAMAMDHHDGRIADALVRSRDLLTITRAFPDHTPSLVSGLVAVGIDALATDRLRKLAWYHPPALDGDGEAAAWRKARPQVEKVIGELLDTEHDAAVLRKSFQGERAFAMSILNTPANAALFGVPSASVARPFVGSALLRYIDDETRAATDPLDFAVLSQLFHFQRPAGGSAAAAVCDYLMSLFGTSMEQAVVNFGTVRTHRRGAAVILAAKLVHADTGRWPGTLDELVPAYLPRVPDDPFLPPGTPMRLRTDAAVPFVYSVGGDMTDDGGSVRVTDSATAPAGYAMPSNRQDLVYPLYLPPVAGRFTLNFNVWYWLEDPDAAVEAAEREEAVEVERRAADSRQKVPDELDVEGQYEWPDDEGDE